MSALTVAAVEPYARAVLRHSALLVALLSCLLAPIASAQEAEETGDDGPITAEEPDPTRLDVERLPPEAIPVTRALYAHGFFLEATIGAIGFINGIGDLSDPGPWVSVGFGYEIVEWLHILVAGEGSMHNTAAPAPPARTAFEIVGGSVTARLQANITEAFALWLSAQAALLVVTTDVLRLYGFQDSTTVGVAYGGEVGFDWHFRSRHHSMGLLGGVRHYPSLESMVGSGPTLGVHGSAYLRYVF